MLVTVVLVTFPLLSLALYVSDHGDLPVKATLIGFAFPPTQLLALPVTTAVGRGDILIKVLVVLVQSVVGFA